MLQVGRLTISGLSAIRSADGYSFVGFAEIHRELCGSGGIMDGTFSHFTGYFEVGWGEIVEVTL